MRGTATSVALAVVALCAVACGGGSSTTGGDPLVAPPGRPKLALLGTVTVPRVQRGHVRVVRSGPVSTRQTVPIIVRNGVKEPVRTVVVTGRSTAKGKSVSGESQLLMPDQLATGGITIGLVYFRTAPDPGATVSFGVKQGDQPPSTATTVDLPIEGLRSTLGQLVGTVRNDQQSEVGLLSITAVCQRADGVLADARTGPTKVPNVRAGSTVGFTLDMDKDCTGFLVGAQGATSTDPTAQQIFQAPTSIPGPSDDPSAGTATTATAPSSDPSTTDASISEPSTAGPSTTVVP